MGTQKHIDNRDAAATAQAPMMAGVLSCLK